MQPDAAAAIVGIPQNSLSAGMPGEEKHIGYCDQHCRAMGYSSGYLVTPLGAPADEKNPNINGAGFIDGGCACVRDIEPSPMF